MSKNIIGNNNCVILIFGVRPLGLGPLLGVGIFGAYFVRKTYEWWLGALSIGPRFSENIICIHVVGSHTVVAEQDEAEGGVEALTNVLNG